MWVIDILEDTVLQDHVRAAAGMIPVGGHILKVIVVQMCTLDIVDRRVPLIGIAEPVVMNRHLGRHVRGPADAECLVVIAENIP